MASEDWSSLPSIITVQIFSYLNLTDKLNASSVCHRWRNCLFHPTLWKDYCLRLKTSTRKRNLNIADVCAKFAREIILEFQTRNAFSMRECIGLLNTIADNTNLKSLMLKPSSFRVEWPERMSGDSRRLMLSALENMVKTSRNLKQLSLGCIGDLSDHSDKIIKLLRENQAHSLEVLHISSVKEDPDSYGLIDLSPDPLAGFDKLTVLGIDYDYLTNYMLLNFCNTNNNCRVPLQKLVIHVHGIESDHEKITNKTWRHVVSANPNLEVTLNLIHSIDGATGILDILQPSMPLAHLRMFFCQYLNVAGIDYISQHMADNFKSIHIIDGMPSYEEPIMFEYSTDENPFVMLAWKCANLSEFTLIGYEMDRDDVIAMTRLRGAGLTKLVVPECCIVDIEERDWGMCVNVGGVDQQLVYEVSKNLGRDWHPINYCEIPKAVFDPSVDCENAYLGILLNDQG